jgi:alcohol dehydrogenase class IV
MNMEQFQPFGFVHSSRRLLFGWGALEKTGEIAREFECRRPAIVLDAFFANAPAAVELAARLQNACGRAPVVHAVPAHEPDIDTIEACRAALESADPDLVVAVGGGSAMDTAKIARMLLSNPGPVEGIAGFGKRLRPHASVLVAVPTTAGTGSEVSESAIAGKPGHEVKLIFRSQDMTPQVAVLDPALSVSAPAVVTAYSGYDAVTHAVEAFVSKMASPMTDPLAVSAMELLARWLPVAWREPGHRDARAACLIASAQAAIAFNSANLGLAHAISAPLGAQLHVAHGLGNALALPYVTAFNEPVLGEKGEVVRRIFGGESAAHGLALLRRAVRLDLSLDDYVPSAEARARVAQSAMKSGQVRMNPRAATPSDMDAILESMRRPTGDAPPRLG